MAEVDTNLSGIYQILNLVNGKFYIGSAINFKDRWNLHLSQLRNNTHDNRHLLAAFNKYGEAHFKFEILEICDRTNLLAKEQFWLDWTKAYEIGYNICKDVYRSRLGVKSTPEHIEKIRLAHLGSKRSEQACINIGLAKKGSKLTEQQKQARRDYRHSEEAKSKISSRRGWKHSTEAKAKMSLARKLSAQRKTISFLSNLGPQINGRN